MVSRLRILYFSFFILLLVSPVSAQTLLPPEETPETALPTFPQVPSTEIAQKATPIATALPPEMAEGVPAPLTPQVDLSLSGIAPPALSNGEESQPTLAADSSLLAPTGMASDGVAGFVPQQILVTFSQDASAERRGDVLRTMGARQRWFLEDLGMALIELPAGMGVEEAIAELKGSAGVLSAEPDYIVSMQDTIPNNPSFATQWGLTAIKAPQGWDRAAGSAAITIAVLDTGIDYTHPDLATKVTSGYDFINNDNDPWDDSASNHGTFASGIAAAVTNNGLGVSGVSWGARIMPVKVLDSFGNGSYGTLIQGMQWAASHGAQILNLSLGGTVHSPALELAVNDLVNNKGVMIVAASGNDGTAGLRYPAAYASVVAVGATDSANHRAAISNYGTGLDLMAPGINIYATMVGGGYGTKDGTSESTAYVSGLAAILWGVPGYGNNTLITQLMERTALDIGMAGYDQMTGYGLIQMDRAINQIVPEPVYGKIDRDDKEVFAIPSRTPNLLWWPTPTRTAGATGLAELLVAPVQGFNLMGENDPAVVSSLQEFFAPSKQSPELGNRSPDPPSPGAVPEGQDAEDPPGSSQEVNFTLMLSLSLLGLGSGLILVAFGLLRR